MDAAKYLPHAQPMVLIDEIVSVDERSAVAQSEIRQDHLFLREDGKLERSSFLELMAQCFAAGACLLATKQAPRLGYLAAVKDFLILADIYLGDLVLIKTNLLAQVAEILVVDGQICRKEELVSKANFKIFVPKVAQ